MECRLSERNVPWTCTIKLRKEVDEDGEQLSSPIVIEFGEPITDKNQVEDRIRRAQIVR